MSRLSIKDIKNYKEKGVVLIKNVFTEDEVAFMRKRAYEALNVRNLKYKHDAVEKTKTGAPAILFWPSFVSSGLDLMRTDYRLAGIVRDFLGPDVKQLNNQVYFREAGDSDEFAWHQDVTFRRPRFEYPGIETSYLQTIIVIDPITRDNGAIEFIEGSHPLGERDDLADGTKPESLRHFERKGLSGTYYEADPGDVLVWSVLTIHASEKNESDKSRMTYMNGFAKADAALRWPYYLKNNKIVKLDHTLIP